MAVVSSQTLENASQLGAPGIARAFVMRNQADIGSPVGRFDDVVVWLGWGPVADNLMLAWQVQ